MGGRQAGEGGEDGGATIQIPVISDGMEGNRHRKGWARVFAGRGEALAAVAGDGDAELCGELAFEGGCGLEEGEVLGLGVTPAPGDDILPVREEGASLKAVDQDEALRAGKGMEGDGALMDVLGDGCGGVCGLRERDVGTLGGVVVGQHFRDGTAVEAVEQDGLHGL